MISKIAISGRAGTGKDFWAKKIGQEFGHARVSFADEIKSRMVGMLKKEFPELPIKDMMRNEKELMRPMMILMGEIGKKIKDDYWIEKSHLDSYDNVVVTDMRYKSDCEYLLNKGFKIIRLSMPIDLRIYLNQKMPDDILYANNSLESDLDMLDCIVDDDMDKDNRWLKRVGWTELPEWMYDEDRECMEEFHEEFNRIVWEEIKEFVGENK